MQIKAVVIPQDLEQPLRTITFDRGDIVTMQTIVGGRFEVLDIPTLRASVWSNDEGHLIGLPVNERATMFLWINAHEHMGYNVLTGDCLVTGRPDVSTFSPYQRSRL